MNYKNALHLSYALIVVSLCALVFTVLASVIGLHLPDGPYRVLQVTSLVWPLAFYAAAVYRRKVAQDAAQHAAKSGEG